jgi:hypothetical protein
MRILTALILQRKEVDAMQHRNGQIGNGGQDASDMFCRSVIAAVAAMLALKLCRYIRRLLQG